MLLIDGNALAARAFFGTHYRLIEAGTDTFDANLFTGAFTKYLFNTMRVLAGVVQPPVVFCVDSHSWRYKIYPEYKQSSARVEMKASVPYKQYLECFHDVCVDIKKYLPISVVKRERYESDDLIAYFVKKEVDLMDAGDHCIAPDPESVMIVTTDKDMKQLLRPPMIQMFDPSDDAVVKVANPDEFLQVLLCTGDKTDNIPAPSRGGATWRFGEKTIPSYYDPKGRCQLKGEFWGKLDKALHESFEQDYEFNKQLIDLSQSPVHDEVISIPEATSYSSNNVERFCRLYMSAHYERNGREIQETMQAYK